MIHAPTTHTIARALDVINSNKLDLTGLVVYTEAATGSYCVTASLAAMSGAKRVIALAGDSRFGTAQEAADATLHFARQAGVEDRIEFVFEKSANELVEADIVTNSGHVRPIDESIVSLLKPTAVVPLMYEAWEFRPKDVDLDACLRKGIAVAGTDENHRFVRALDFIGVSALKLLLDGGVEVAGMRIALWSNNKFCAYIAPVLAAVGAEVLVFCPLELFSGIGSSSQKMRFVSTLDKLPETISQIQNIDCLFLVMSPNGAVCIGESAQALFPSSALATMAPGAIVAQFWGDVDRDSLIRRGLRCLPDSSPPPGHMGILPSDLGFVPILRLQVGGLKVGEILARERLAGGSPECAIEKAVKEGYGQRLFSEIRQEARV